MIESYAIKEMFGGCTKLDVLHKEALELNREYHQNRKKNDSNVDQKLQLAIRSRSSYGSKSNTIQMFTGLANMTLDYASKGEVSFERIVSVLKVLSQYRFLPSQDFRSRASTAIVLIIREQERTQYAPKLLSNFSLLACDVSPEMLRILCSANFNSNDVTLEDLVSDVYASMQFCRVKQTGVGHERYGRILLDQLVFKYTSSDLEVREKYACKMRSIKAHAALIYGVVLDVQISTIVENPWGVSGNNKSIQNALTKMFGSCGAFVFMEEIQEWVDFVVPSEKMVFLLLKKQDYYWNKNTILPKTKLIADLLRKDCGYKVVILDNEMIEGIMKEQVENKRLGALVTYIEKAIANHEVSNRIFVARVQSSGLNELER